MTIAAQVVARGDEDRMTSANVKVFGCRPHEGGAAHSGAGVRKPPMEETAGRDTLVVRRALWGFECRERCG